MVIVHCFLLVVVARGWELHKMDINNAFLHEDLDEEVYMTFPLGCYAPTSQKVCKLKNLFMG